MPPEALPDLAGFVALLAMLAYAVLAGADFGGGIWDLFAVGPRAGEHRAAIARAMGPVWEANHVWLIFLIVVLFSAFPPAYGLLSVALYWPFHLVLLGIALRGAAFVFRAHGQGQGTWGPGWGRVFGAASVITPVLLGACLGAVSSGRVRVVEGNLAAGSDTAWLTPLAITIGLLALAICAYLAAVYLTVETAGAVREDFRRRALGVWLVGGVLSLGVLMLTYGEAPHLWEGLTTPRASPVVVVGMLLAPASALALLRRHWGLARVLAAAQVVLLLVGWGLAQWPYLVYPDVTLDAAAAPSATLVAVLGTVPIGMALLLPSLWLLFAVFKGRNPAL